ncbi:unnamed protein product, partial [Toxocara canis]|uniref:Virion structural protein n=1 Tax=Toxocara canis TaxID=6265 RepID=A0A183TYC8_TOXCA
MPCQMTFDAMPGGYRIELLNANDKVITILTDGTEFVGNDDTTKTSDVVYVPEGLECLNCAVRLVKQATEYASNYVFYSCADVNIANGKIFWIVIDEYDVNISRLRAIFESFSFYSSSFLATLDDSVIVVAYDVEQVMNAKKMSIAADMASVYRWGIREIHKSSVSVPADITDAAATMAKTRTFSRDPEFDPSLYNLREVGADQDKIYWRIVQDELEVVLKFKGDSWAGIGWKPVNSSRKCTSVSAFGIYKNGFGTSSGEKSAELDEEGSVAKPVSHLLPVEPIFKNNSRA